MVYVTEAAITGDVHLKNQRNVGKKHGLCSVVALDHRFFIFFKELHVHTYWH